MKYIITETQYNLIKENTILQLPGVEYFGGYEGMLKYLEKKGNPLFGIVGNLTLNKRSIKSIGNLISVGGDLDLRGTSIKSLGNLTSVGGDLDLYGTDIESLGNLTSVGGDLDLRLASLSEKYNKKQIRKIVNVRGKIYL